MENTLESIKSVISRRRPFLLYAFDVINRNYFALQQQLHPAIPQGHDMTVTFLFPASLNRSVEIMKHVASLYAPQSGECLCKIEPVIYSADSELWCVQHSWADQGENAMILDGTRHCNPEHIRSLIKRSAVFRVYNEYDLTNIADAFQCHGEENEEQELKEIKILLPSSGWASRKGECHRHVHAHDDGGSLRSLLGEIEKTLKNGEDVHFKVVGLHTFMALPTQDVNDGTEIKKAFESLDTEFNMLIKARKDALCAQEESLVQVGGLQLHITGCTGLHHLSKSLRSTIMASIHREVVNVKFDVGNDLLSEAICLVDRVVGSSSRDVISPVSSGASYIVVEEGPTDPTAEAFPVLGLDGLTSRGRHADELAPAVPILSFAKDVGESETFGEFEHGLPEVGDFVVFKYNMQISETGHAIHHEEQYRGGSRYCEGRYIPNAHEFLKEFCISPGGQTFTQVKSIRAYEQANAEVLQRASQAEDCVLSLKQEIQALKEQLKNINSANSKS